MSIDTFRYACNRERDRIETMPEPADRAHAAMRLERIARRLVEQCGKLRASAYRELRDVYCWSSLDLGKEYGHSRQRALEIMK